MDERSGCWIGKAAGESVVMGEVLVECEQRYLHKYLFIQGGSHFLLGDALAGSARVLKWQEGATFERDARATEREGQPSQVLAGTSRPRGPSLRGRREIILPFRA